MPEKFTIKDFAAKKKASRKITVLTAYDYPMAKIIDSCGVDVVLVGDSLGMVVLGYDSTVSVTMDEMIHHCKAARRGVERAFLIGDMPFMSYQASDAEAVTNAGRFIKEAGCEAVKVEGGKEIVPRIIAMIDAGIPVMGHIGLTPQSVTKLGGYKVQGKDAESAARFVEDAIALEKAGCFSLVIECVPRELGAEITRRIKIPAISCGAGVDCDGQVLVTHDMVGFYDRFTPKFVRKFADVKGCIEGAVRRYKDEVEAGTFPDDLHSYASEK
jgi:3-methyl-2-oxobutanoate hydroxymethyltransferase